MTTLRLPLVGGALLLLLAVPGCSGADSSAQGSSTATSSPAASTPAPTTSATGDPGTSATPAGTPSSPGNGRVRGPVAAPQAGFPVEVTRSGGIAGGADRLTVTADGGWSRTDPTGRRTAGVLNDGELVRLQKLATSPALTTDRTLATTSSRCRDAYAWTVTAAQRTVSYVECPGEAQPATAVAIVALLNQATTR
jgi:hypothetical protein